jgi:hypothetical protein
VLTVPQATSPLDALAIDELVVVRCEHMCFDENTFYVERTRRICSHVQNVFSPSDNFTFDELVVFMGTHSTWREHILCRENTFYAIERTYSIL